MIDVENLNQAIRFLEDVLRYLGAYYGGTLGHHIISLRLQELRDAKA